MEGYGQINNLTVVEEEKKLKVVLIFDFDQDGEPDLLSSSIAKKLGGDLNAELIKKLKAIYSGSFPLPRVLFVRSTWTGINIDLIRTEFPQIMKVEQLELESRRVIERPLTFLFWMKSQKDKVWFFLRKEKEQGILAQTEITLPVQSIVAEVCGFLKTAFANFGWPEKLLNLTASAFSFEENLYYFTSWTDPEIIPINDYEHITFKKQ